MENIIISQEEQAKKYNDAYLLMESGDVSLMRSATEYFTELADYKDSAEKAEECKKQTEERIKQIEKNRKFMRYNIVVICIALIAILTVLSLFIGTLIYRQKNYRKFTQTDPVPSNIETDISDMLPDTEES